MTELVPLPRTSGPHHRRPDSEDAFRRSVLSELAAIRSNVSRVLSRQSRQTEMMMGTQADIDRIAQGLVKIDADVNADSSSLALAIADLKANPNVDTSALEAAFGQLGRDVSSLSTLAGPGSGNSIDSGSGSADPATPSTPADPTGSDPTGSDPGAPAGDAPAPADSGFVNPDPGTNGGFSTPPDGA